MEILRCQENCKRLQAVYIEEVNPALVPPRQASYDNLHELCSQGKDESFG